MVVLREFKQQSTDDDGKSVLTEGFVFSSKSFLVNCQPDGLSLQTDGTYKLLFNGWVLSVLSGHSVNFSDGGIITTRLRFNSNFVLIERHCRHSSVPFLYSLCRAESQVTYEALLDTMFVWATLYGHENVRIKSYTHDHSYAIRNAFVKACVEHQSEDAECVDCYAATRALNSN